MRAVPEPGCAGRGRSVRPACREDDKDPGGVVNGYGQAVPGICVCGDRKDRRLLQTPETHKRDGQGPVHRRGDHAGLPGGGSILEDAWRQGAHCPLFRGLHPRGGAGGHVRRHDGLPGEGQEDPAPQKAGSAGGPADGEPGGGGGRDGHCLPAGRQQGGAGGRKAAAAYAGNAIKRGGVPGRPQYKQAKYKKAMECIRRFARYTGNGGQTGFKARGMEGVPGWRSLFLFLWAGGQ